MGWRAVAGPSVVALASTLEVRDSDGNLHTAEARRGRRAQFTFTGMVPAR